MTDKEVLEQEVVEVEPKKPSMVFEEEFEIIPEDQVIEEPVEPAAEVDLDAILEEKLAALKPAQSTDNELAEVLKNLNQTLAPKPEAVAQRDWEKFYEEQADELTTDPKKAVKNIVEALASEFGGALKAQSGQIVESQKETSKLLAKGDPSLKVVFDNWGSEVDSVVQGMIVRPGQSAVSLYNEAAKQVKLNHLDDILELKMQEFAKSQTESAPIGRSRVSSSPSAPPVEGEAPKKIRYAATNEQLARIKRSINPDLTRQRMIDRGELKRIR